MRFLFPLADVHRRGLGRAALLLIAALACPALPALAGPGAHGPNGEHLDTPAAAAGAAAAAVPRLEAKSELFELVATLSGGELSMLIDRYETNEPVLQARVEVEADGHKATAKFHADLGDYAIDDEAFLKALSQPGEHALVFTVIAGEDSDLLDGTLSVREGGVDDTAGPGHSHAGASDADHEHEQAFPVSSTAAALAGLGLLGAGALWWRRRRNERLNPEGVTR